MGLGDFKPYQKKPGWSVKGCEGLAISELEVRVTRRVRELLAELKALRSSQSPGGAFLAMDRHPSTQSAG